MTRARIDRQTRRLLFVWAALLGLLALTVVGTLLPVPSAARTAAAFAIALAKAGLIFWFFMHGREVSGLIRLAGVAAFLWIAIMLTLSGADYARRHPESGATFSPAPDRNRPSEAGLPP